VINSIITKTIQSFSFGTTEKKTKQNKNKNNTKGRQQRCASEFALQRSNSKRS